MLLLLLMMMMMIMIIMMMMTQVHAALGLGSVAVSLAKRAVDMENGSLLPLLSLIRSLLAAATAAMSPLAEGGVPLPPPQPPLDGLLKVMLVMVVKPTAAAAASAADRSANIFHHHLNRKLPGTSSCGGGCQAPSPQRASVVAAERSCCRRARQTCQCRRFEGISEPLWNGISRSVSRLFFLGLDDDSCCFCRRIVW
jgi:hypothetical protein